MKNTAGYSPDIKKVTTAIIPVAGLGTRMLPATKAIPKELLPIIDKPIIQYVVEEAIGAGIKEFIQDNAAKRPSYSVLDNEKILKDYDIVSSDIKKGIKNSLKSYLTK